MDAFQHGLGLVARNGQRKMTAFGQTNGSRKGQGNLVHEELLPVAQDGHAPLVPGRGQVAQQPDTSIRNLPL